MTRRSAARREEAFSVLQLHDNNVVEFLRGFSFIFFVYASVHIRKLNGAKRNEIARSSYYVYEQGCWTFISDAKEENLNVWYVLQRRCDYERADRRGEQNERAETGGGKN